MVSISRLLRNYISIVFYYPAWRTLQRSGVFNRRWYLDRNPDVREAGIDPIVHYLQYGAKEWRQPGPTFDGIWYCNRYEDVAEQGVNPLLHYLRYGFEEKREISAPFQRGLGRAVEHWLSDATYSQRHTVVGEGTEKKAVLQSLDFLKRTLVERYGTQRQDHLVTIIMPFANDKLTLQASIASVLGQTYGNLELILCSDASTDGSLDVAKSCAGRDSRVRIVTCDEAQGPAVARNRGLSESRGTYIAYLDSDDIWDKDFLSIMVGEAIATDKDFLYCAQYVWSRDNWSDGRTYDFIRYNAYHRSKLENTNYISLISILHHRKLYELHGGFDESLTRVEDYDLALRYTAASRVLSVPVPLCHYLINLKRRKQNLRRRGPIEPALERIRAHVRGGRELKLPEVARLSAHTFYAQAPANPHLYNGGADRQNDKVTYVVLPVCETLEHLQACVAALCAYTERYHCIVVDNVSSQSLRTYLQELPEDNFTVILRPKVSGFSKLVNIGLQQVPPGHDVVILNNDAVVTPNWLTALHDTASAEPKAGIVVPQQVVCPQDRTIHQHIPDADPSYECDIALSDLHKNVIKNTGNSLETVKLSLASFFCVLIRAPLLAKLPKLDDNHHKHTSSNVSYCHLTCIVGREIVYSPNAKVYRLIR